MKSFIEIVRCPTCGKKYDVTHLNVGDRFDCTKCDEKCTVPEIVSRFPTSVRVRVPVTRSMHTTAFEDDPFRSAAGAVSDGISSMVKGILPW